MDLIFVNGKLLPFGEGKISRDLKSVDLKPMPVVVKTISALIYSDLGHLRARLELAHGGSAEPLHCYHGIAIDTYLYEMELVGQN